MEGPSILEHLFCPVKTHALGRGALPIVPCTSATARLDPGTLFPTGVWVLGLILLRNLGTFDLPLDNWWALFILIPAVGAFESALRSYRSAGDRLAAPARGPKNVETCYQRILSRRSGIQGRSTIPRAREIASIRPERMETSLQWLRDESFGVL